MTSYKMIVGIVVALFIIVGCIAFGFLIQSTEEISKDRRENPRLVYREAYFNQSSSSLMQEAFKTIPQARPGSVALVLRGDVAEHELSYALDKGYDLIVEDSQSIHFTLLLPGDTTVRKRIKTHIGRLDLETVPMLDLVMTNVDLPHYPPQEFATVWKTIQRKTKPGSYFIGHFMGLGGSVLTKEVYGEEMTFLTKGQIRQLFKGWKILKINEAKSEHPEPLGRIHYYEVFAQKIQP